MIDVEGCSGHRGRVVGSGSAGAAEVKASDHMVHSRLPEVAGRGVGAHRPFNEGVAKKRDTADSTPATALLHREGIAFSAHTYVHDPRAASFGLEAAEALGLEPARVFKTLMAEVDSDLAVAIVPVTASLDLKALASALGGKRAQMADPALAQRATGYVLGGISPIGQKKQHRTVLDETADQWPTIYVSGGRRGLDLELVPDDLVMVTAAVRAAIAR